MIRVTSLWEVVEAVAHLEVLYSDSKFPLRKLPTHPRQVIEAKPLQGQKGPQHSGPGAFSLSVPWLQRNLSLVEQ